MGLKLTQVDAFTDTPFKGNPLLSFRPPSLIALNEPETSIHPDLFEPLAKLVAKASTNSQLWITTHSRELADWILEHTGVEPIELQKVNGETQIVGARLSDEEP